MILITTAGKVGSEAARQLAQRGEPVRILVRNREKATLLMQAGGDVYVGDLDVPASVDQAMQGVSRVVLVTPPVVQQELTVIDSAVRAGVEHVVKITSKASADSPIARRRNQTQIESALIASGLGYTFLRNNAYMQNFLMMAPLIKKTNSFSNATGEGRIGYRQRLRRGVLLNPRRPLDRSPQPASSVPKSKRVFRVTLAETRRGWKSRSSRRRTRDCPAPTWAAR